MDGTANVVSDNCFNGRWPSQTEKTMKVASRLFVLLFSLGLLQAEDFGTTSFAWAQALSFPPTLPDGKSMVTITSPKLLEPRNVMREGVVVATTPPRVDFLYYLGQDHPGRPWSNWGDSFAVGGKYYSAVGDHEKPRGTAQVYEYDPQTQRLRLLVDLRKFLEKSGALAADENYTSGKIHTRLDLGDDGWLYYAGHRGSTRTTNDAHGFRGERVFRTHPESGKTEIVAEFPVPKHVIPMSVLDPRRMIFYGGTAAGEDAQRQGVCFFAYDVRNRRLLTTASNGPKRCAIFAQSTGQLYWEGHRYDPQANQITPAPQLPNIRSATRETPTGHVYGTSDRSADLWRFNVRSEEVERLGPGAVATAEYVTTIDADPTGRYLYYIPGAHGRAEQDGTPVVQFDVKTKTRKVLCFLAPLLTSECGYTPIGTFGSALSEDGSKLYVTWNGYRQGAADAWDVCAMTAIHIPASERAVENEDHANGPPDAVNRSFSFRDVTKQSGLLPYVAGLKGHAAGWGDADGNGWIDLYVGSFHTGRSKPNLLFRNHAGKFEYDEAQSLEISSRPYRCYMGRPGQRRRP